MNDCMCLSLGQPDLSVGGQPKCTEAVRKNRGPKVTKTFLCVLIFPFHGKPMVLMCNEHSFSLYFQYN